MLKRVPKMCITCRHYEPRGWKCMVDMHYIGYAEGEERNKCKAYSLHDNYRRGGKWYESRKVKLDAAD